MKVTLPRATSPPPVIWRPSTTVAHVPGASAAAGTEGPAAASAAPVPTAATSPATEGATHTVATAPTVMADAGLAIRSAGAGGASGPGAFLRAAAARARRAPRGAVGAGEAAAHPAVPVRRPEVRHAAAPTGHQQRVAVGAENRRPAAAAAGRPTGTRTAAATESEPAPAEVFLAAHDHGVDGPGLQLQRPRRPSARNRSWSGQATRRAVHRHHGRRHPRRHRPGLARTGALNVSLTVAEAASAGAAPEARTTAPTATPPRRPRPNRGEGTVRMVWASWTATRARGEEAGPTCWRPHSPRRDENHHLAAQRTRHSRH